MCLARICTVGLTCNLSEPQCARGLHGQNGFKDWNDNKTACSNLPKQVAFSFCR